MNLYFYNYWHNGDIHYSREFVKDIISKTNFDNYFYAHNNKFGLLKDIEKLTEIKFETIGNTELNTLNIFDKNNDVYINTWIGQLKMKYIGFGINVHSNYMIYKDIYRQLNISMNDVKTYIPKINFDVINKQPIDSFFEDRKKNVLICNGKLCSNQSTPQPFEPFIMDLSEKFSTFNFIFTDNTNKIDRENIFYTDDIIGLNTTIVTDLNEISYLSTFCDVIIGKESGPFAFSTIEDNMNGNKTFINFCDRKDWCWDPYATCQYEWSNNYNLNVMYDLIKKTINKYEN